MFLPRSLQLRLLNIVDADAVPSAMPSSAMEEDECTRKLASLVADYFRKRGLNKTLARFVKESRLVNLQAIYSSYKGSKNSGSSKKRKKKKLNEDESFETGLEREISGAILKKVKLYDSTSGQDKKARKKKMASILTNGSSCVVVDTVEAGKEQELQTSMKENGVRVFSNIKDSEPVTSLPNGDFRHVSKSCRKISLAKKETSKSCLEGSLASPVDTAFGSSEHGKKSKWSKSDDCVPSKGFQVEQERGGDFSEKQAAQEHTWSCRKHGERGESIFNKDYNTGKNQKFFPGKHASANGKATK